MKKILCKSVTLLAALLLLFACLPACGEDASFVTLNSTDLTVAAGAKRQLTLSFINSAKRKQKETVWQSDNEAIATVNNKGVITGVSEGEATISCKVTLTQDGQENTVKCHVTVYFPVTDLEQEDKQIRLLPGETKQIPVTILPENATNPTLQWRSIDQNIVTVDEQGTVTAQDAGKTRVVATTTDGSKKTVAWEVIIPTVYAEKETYEINSLGTFEIPVIFDGEDFDKRCRVEMTGVGVEYEVEASSNPVVFTVTPTNAGETHLLITDKKNPWCVTDITINVSNDALSSSDRLAITSAELLEDIPILAYKFELQNRSGEEVGEVGFLVDYRDQFGDTHYLVSNTDGTIQNHQYTTMINILPGETGTVYGQNEVFRANDLIKEVRLAVYYYRYLSGQKVYIPDSQLYWFSTKDGELPRPTTGPNYVQPDEDTLDRAMRINMGANQCTLYSYTVKEFSRSKRPGIYLANMNDTGYAAAWGLQPGDVIYGADDTLWANDPFILNRALCDVYDGKTVILKVVRNGEEIEVEIQKEIKQEEPEE